MLNMEKKRLSKILARSDKKDLAVLSSEIQKSCRPVIVKAPTKTLAMIKMREPVKKSQFYLGEVIVCEAAVEIDGVSGMAVVMGDDTERALDMAIIDAAVNKGIFKWADRLLEWEKAQQEREGRENALHRKTAVNFESLDKEAPTDVNSFKKA